MALSTTDTAQLSHSSSRLQLPCELVEEDPTPDLEAMLVELLPRTLLGAGLAAEKILWAVAVDKAAKRQPIDILVNWQSLSLVKGSSNGRLRAPLAKTISSFNCDKDCLRSWASVKHEGRPSPEPSTAAVQRSMYEARWGSDRQKLIKEWINLF